MLNQQKKQVWVNTGMFANLQAQLMLCMECRCGVTALKKSTASRLCCIAAVSGQAYYIQDADIYMRWDCLAARLHSVPLLMGLGA